jgi:glycosyltransferase involved in cell wall biosynthesis
LKKTKVKYFNFHKNTATLLLDISEDALVGTNSLQLFSNGELLGTSQQVINDTDLLCFFFNSEKKFIPEYKPTSLTLRFLKDSKFIHQEGLSLNEKKIDKILPISKDVEWSKNTSLKLGKKIILVQSFFPYPTDQGNKVILDQLISWLRSNSYEIIFIIQDKKNTSLIQLMIPKCDYFYFVPYDIAMKQKDPRLTDTDKTTPLLSWSINHLVEKHKPEAIIVQYASLCNSLNYISKPVKTFCFTHDVQHRFKTELISKGVDVVKNRIISRGEEIKRLSKVDTIVAINNFEKDFYKRMLPNKNIITTGLYNKHNKFSPEISQGANLKLIYVASDNKPNSVGLREFLGDVWPIVLEKHPNCHLDIIGGVCKQFQKTSTPNVSFHGYVDDLVPFYTNAQICLNLTTFGTGLKIKTIESITLGKATITTLKGAEGIELHNGELPLIVTENKKELAKAIISTYNNFEVIQSLESKARNYTNKMLGITEVYKELKLSLSSNEEKLEKKRTYNKILIDFTELRDWKGHRTGIQNVIFHISKALIIKDRDVSFIFYDSKTNSFYKENYPLFLYNSPPVTEPIALQANTFSNTTYLNMGRAWHQGNYLETLMQFKKSTNFTIAHLIYDLIPLQAPHFFGKNLPPLYRQWTDKVIPNSDKILTISQHSKKDILEFYPKEAKKIKVIHLGDYDL